MNMDLRAEDIVGEDIIIDKLEMVKGFLNANSYKETKLTSVESLSNFLKNEIKSKFGVYCIYNENKVLDIGKSKNLKGRIREQLIGRKSRKDNTQPRKFPRLFFAFLKRDYNRMKEKEYNDLPDIKNQNLIFRSGNTLRVFFTKDHIRAIVLEHTLIKYFKSMGQCEYNFQI
jgi:excinuclease UvrABC nuclease subunit